MKIPVRIKSFKKITHDVLQVQTEKPPQFDFVPGQATEIFVTKEAWENEGRPFTFTSLPTDDHLEFTIKAYASRNGVTNQLWQSKEGDEIIVNDIFGAIAYKGEGTFIARGAGVTPFISILRHLRSTNAIGNNKLIFANKTKADIILEDEFKQMLGSNFINILSDEKTEEYAYGHITADFLKMHITDLNQKFYICGPPPMMDAIEKQLGDLGVNETSIVKEEF